jgi:hypothetical protein
MLLLDGQKGMAVLRLDFTTAAERKRLATKARLMATALSAEACACIFTGRLERPHRSPVSVVVAIAETLSGGATAVFVHDRAADRPVLRPLATGLAGRRLAGTLAGILDGLLPSAPSDRDSARAWRELEAMGVNIGSGGRALH